MAKKHERDLHEKALYCLQMMSLARHIANGLDEDDLKRIVGRFVLVVLDSYIPLARRLKNLLAAPKATKTLGDELNKLADDYHGYYDRIRDKLSAHRQDLPIDEAWDTWNEIDAVTVTVLTDDAISTYQRLARLDAQVPPFAPLAAESEPNLVAPATTTASEDLKFSADTLAMTRGEAGIVPTHVVQVRGGEVLSVIHILNATATLVERIKLDLDAARLLKTMLIVDLCNLYDLLYGVAAGHDPGQPSFLDILEDGRSSGGAFAGAALLRADVADFDRAKLDDLRFLRNKICAHVDWALPLAHLLSELDQLDDAFFNDLYKPAFDGFVAACQADPATNIFLLLGRPLAGLKLAEPIEAQRAFD